MTSRVMSIWDLDTASFIGSAMKSRSVPKASECSRTRILPSSPRSLSTRSISATTSARRASSAALTLKKCASRPSVRMSPATRWALGWVDFRSRCTPKMSQPARASARLTAAPNPEDAPRISAQPPSSIGFASALMVISVASSLDQAGASSKRFILASLSRSDPGHPGEGDPGSPLEARATMRAPMASTAGIVLIGNEILSGKVVDANAAYLCRELRQLGVDVRRIAVIPDEVDLIARTVAEFSRSFDIVFTSGGVGPTHDDVTIEGVARAFETRVVRHPDLVRLLDGFYRGELNEARLKMAEVPDGAELFI